MSTNEFTWRPFFIELFQTLTQKHDVGSLAKVAIDLFGSIENGGIKEQKSKGKLTDIFEIDPFTFIANINKYAKDEKRIELCKVLKASLNLKSDVPSDFLGVPTSNPQNVNLFAFAYERNKDDLQALWRLAKELCSNDVVKDKTFSDALKVKYNGLSKLTAVMFSVFPDRFLPLNKKTFEALAEIGLDGEAFLDEKETSFTKMNEFINQVKAKMPGKSLAEISHRGHLLISDEDSDEAGSFDEIRAQFQKSDFDAYIAVIKQIVLDLKILPDDARVVFSSRQKRLSFTVGQRYALALKKQGSEAEFGFGTLEKTKLTESPFNGSPEAFYNITKAISDVEKYRAQIVAFAEEQLKITTRSCFFKHDDSNFRKLIFGEGNQLSIDRSNTFWMAGSSWNGEDKTQDFVREGIWQNGYGADSDDPSIETVKLAKAGDWVAIKSSSTKGPGRSITFTKIKALGRIIENFGNGVNLKVDWQYKGPEFDVDGICYRKTFEQAKRDHVDQLFGRFMKNNETAQKTSDPFWNQPRNIIYWGPPGTGKTYRLLELQKQFEDPNDTSNQDRLIRWVQDQSWWDVTAAALIELAKPVTVPELFEHDLIQLKAKYSSTKTPKNTLWGALQAHTIKESKTVSYTQRQEPLVVDKNENSAWYLSGAWKEPLADLIAELKTLRQQGQPEVAKRYEIVTFHQSYSYEEFVEGIRPETSEDGSTVKYEVRPGVFRRLCQRAEENSDQQYALFIDEINRGNLSKIFGELITLIESDKRLGMKHPIKLVLPYSGQSFGVPKNLHIIGTMNSVDRSIALVDMALRRRFHFETIRPDPNCVPKEVNGIPLRDIFSKLNEKIAVLLGSEYQLGHSYFMNERSETVDEIKKTWFQNVLPLLQEYFFDDWEKLKALVGNFVLEKAVGGLNGVSLTRNTIGTFVDGTLSNEEFETLLKSLS